MSKSVLQKEKNEMFARVRLRLQTRDRLMAGCPRGESPLDYFMSSRHMSDAEKEDFATRIKGGELTQTEKDEIKDMSWCCFEKDHDGNLCVWHGNIKALLREIFVTFGLTQKAPIKAKRGQTPDEARDEAAGAKGKGKPGEAKEGAAGGRQTFQHAVHIDGVKPAQGKTEQFCAVRILIEKNGVPLTKADGYVDKVKHIKDAAGERSALGRHDYVDNAELHIELLWPASGVFDEGDMRKAWAAAEEDGIGACRSQGHGKFDVIEWTCINDPKKAGKKQAVLSGTEVDA